MQLRQQVESYDVGITTYGLEGFLSILNPQQALERGHFGGHDAAGLLQGALALFLGRINNLAQVVDGVQVQVFERCAVGGYVSWNRQVKRKHGAPAALAQGVLEQIGRASCREGEV